MWSRLSIDQSVGRNRVAMFCECDRPFLLPWCSNCCSRFCLRTNVNNTCLVSCVTARHCCGPADIAVVYTHARKTVMSSLSVLVAIIPDSMLILSQGAPAHLWRRFRKIFMWANSVIMWIEQWSLNRFFQRKYTDKNVDRPDEKFDSIIPDSHQTITIPAPLRLAVYCRWWCINDGDDATGYVSNCSN